MKCNTIKTLVLFTLLILSFFVSNSSYGSHAVGGEITYICLGQDTAGNDIMQVTLVYYRDCLGVDAPNQVTVCYSSVSCGFNSTFSAPKDTVIDVSPICSGLTSTCQGGSYPGIEQHIFIGQVTLTSQCNDWIFSFATCCRNAAITTGPGSSGFYLEACLNNLDAPCNSSPYFANLPIAFVCDSQQFVFNHGATDPDGDSLVYRIIPPMQGGGCNYTGDVIYNAPYSYTQPLSSSPTIAYDSLTGNITMTPTIVGEVTVMAVRVLEYRNGVYIGCIVRDMQLYVVTCTDSLPELIGGVNGDSSFIDTMCPNVSTCFTIYGTDADTSQTLIMTLSQTLPGATFNTTGTNPITGTFCWTPTSSYLGTNTFTVTIEDDACPYQGYQTYAFTILVQPNPNITLPADRYLECTGTDSLTVSASGTNGGFTFLWSTSATTQSINIVNPGAYSVVATDSLGCYGSDTIEIFKDVNADYDFNIVCLNDTTLISDSSTSGGGSMIAWQWDFGDGNSSVLQDPPHVFGTSGTFSVQLISTDSLFCQDSITQTITVYPLPAFGLNDDTICIFDSILFVASGATTYWWAELSKPNDTISTADSLTVSPVVTTSYIIHGTDGNTCYNEDTVEVWVNPLPILSTSAVPDSICLKDSAVLTTIGAQSYWWAKLDSPGDTISVLNSWTTTFDSTTTLIITGTDSNSCTNTDTFTLDVHPLPVPNAINGSPFICPFDDSIDYHLTDFTAGSYYDWTVTGGTLTNGQGTDSIKIAWDSTGSALITMVETTLYGCMEDTLSFPVNINVLWTPPAPAGPDTICWFDRDGVVYSALFTFGANYYWHIQGGTILSGDSTWQVVVRWDTLGTSYLTYDEENITIDTVCFNPADTLWVLLNSSPSTKTILGDFQVCAFDSGFNYTIADTAGAAYIWTIPGGSIVAGDSTSMITVDWDSAGTYVMSVFEINQYGCVGDTIDTIVNVYVNPTPAGIFGNDTVCAPDSMTVPYWVTGTAGSTFEWIVTGGVIAGQGNDSITVDWALPGVGTLKVVEQSADSCFSDTLEISIVLDNPIVSIEVVSDKFVDDKDIMVTWLLANGLHFNGTYNLYRRAKHVDSLWILIETTSKTYFEDEDRPTSDFSYNYRIDAVNACGNVVGSAVHNSILLAGTAVEESKETLLNWNAYINWPNGVYNYEIWRKLDEENDYAYHSSANLDTFNIDPDGADGYNHCFRILAIENLGFGKVDSSWSNEVCVNFDHLIEIPNAFSPNGDGVNDVWVIKNIKLYPDNTLQIFNRWGNSIYHVKSYQNTFRGVRTSRDPLSHGLPDGNYYYVLTINSGFENIEKVYRGSVLIMR